ncbi:MAG: hypothetical protein LBH60_05990 [Prevotellaceae bacterium]|jgi:hypothetical protein|nr:hypothetical protein [Prevotellaceae bacterium]
MEITPKWKNVKGSFDTKEVEMVCVPSYSYRVIALCIKEKGKRTNFPVANVKLYSGDLYVNFKEAYDDAVKLGEEIARRWNESETKL